MGGDAAGCFINRVQRIIRNVEVIDRLRVIDINSLCLIVEIREQSDDFIVVVFDVVKVRLLFVIIILQTLLCDCVKLCSQNILIVRDHSCDIVQLCIHLCAHLFDVGECVGLRISEEFFCGRQYSGDSFVLCVSCRRA